MKERAGKENVGKGMKYIEGKVLESMKVALAKLEKAKE